MHCSLQENILVVNEGGRKLAKLTDYGLFVRLVGSGGSQQHHPPVTHWFLWHTQRCYSGKRAVCGSWGNQARCSQ